ncbi:MAG: hypothetical protein IID38_05020 [Planctomycetes bacterium]|nr:hypothetical protein [Planctomycetota bacterium]
MTEWTPILDQARLFITQHAPPKLLDETVPLSILFLFLGVGISVLGARLARIGTTLAFAVGGGFLGTYFSHESGFPLPLCVAGAALVIGTIGYQTFRLWVGVMTALVLASFTVGAFSYQQVLPRLAQFEQTVIQTPAGAESVFVPPSPREQQAYRDRTPGQWLEQFRTFLKQQDARIERNGRTLILASLLTGLCLGVVAVRWALVVTTALIGTSLVVSGISVLLNHFAQQEAYQAFEKHPSIVGMAVGGFLMTSLILQTLLTRPAPLPKSRPKPKPAPKS